MKKLKLWMLKGFTLSTFKSIFRTMILLVLIPVSAAVLIAVNSLSLVQKEMTNSNDVIFEEIRDEIDQNFKLTLNLANRVSKDSLIVDYAKENNRDYYKEHEILTELNEVITGFEQVEMVYVYYPQFNRVISNINGADTAYFHSLYYSGDYSKWLDELNIKKNISVTSMKKLTDDVESCTIISNILDIRKDSAQPVVIVQLKKSFFTDLLNRLRLKDKDQILVFFKDSCIGSTWSDNTDEEYLRRIKQYTSNQAEYKINHINYSIRTLVTPRYGLYFIYLTPNSILQNSIQYAKLYAILALIFCVSIAIFFCFLFSKRMDISFHQVKKQNDQLILTVNQYSNVLKEAYLEKIMSGHVASIQGIREGCRLYGIEVEDSWFGLILIHISNDERAKEDVLIKASMKDKLKKQIQQSGVNFNNVSVIKLEEQYYCIVSGKADDAFLFQKELQNSVEQIQTVFRRDDNLSCTGYVSNVFREIQKLHEAYEMVLNLQQKSDAEDEAEVRESDKCSVDKILCVIKKRYADSNFSVADIAENIEVTTSYLSRYFKKQTGMGILEYIHKYRISMSKDIMMQNKDLKIKKIAEMTGFYSDVVFIRVFKKSEGITPGQYKQYLEGQKQNSSGQI
ncbi:MAG: AraC family transcriptional regulator [Anaerocolumna sp.]